MLKGVIMTKWHKTSFVYPCKGITLRAEIDPVFIVYPFIRNVFYQDENITELCGEWVFSELERQIRQEFGYDDED